MNKLLITLGFIIMVLAQWFVPGKMIYEQESVLTTGVPYKFKTQPIDPSDPFRGKYITLRYEMERSLMADSTMQAVKQVYVYIKEGEDGYAEATQVSATALDINQDYVMADMRQAYKGLGRIELPFKRYYMEESKAYDAEVAVRTIMRSRDSLVPVCYALVYVKDDIAVLDNVFIGDISIKDFVTQEE